MNTKFKYDYYAYFGCLYDKKGFKNLLKSSELRYIFYARHALEAHTPLVRFMFRLLRHHMSAKLQLSLPFQNIGMGFTIYHGSGIAVNDNACLGNFVSIHNGVTIGGENRGKRKGAPVIGNQVWIGSNAVIVGNITIGNDVLIAPNAFVNFSVPDHSIVIGNPGVIKHRQWATKDYIRGFPETTDLTILK